MAVANPKPMHPGRVLASVFMADHSLNQTQLAKKLGCSAAKVNEIVNGRRGISAQFAIELEEIFNLSAAVWVRMQGEYDLWLERQKKRPRKAAGAGSRLSSASSATAARGRARD